MSESLELSIVVPVYESAETLRGLSERLVAAASQITASFEIIFVDDGSQDKSWQVLSALISENPLIIKGLQLMRNYGQHNALMCGFKHSNGRIIVTLDDDLQNPPEEMYRLYQYLEETGTDVLYGLPFRRNDGSFRKLASIPIQFFIQKSIGLPGPVSAYRLIRRPVIDAILCYKLNFTFIDGLISWNTSRISYLEIEHQPRSRGRSGYSIRKLLLHALNIITNFSIFPLQIASATGLVTSLLGLSLGIFYLIQYSINNISVPGYASTIIAILTLGGLQLLALGIVGEYVGRVHLNINSKPQYTVRAKNLRNEK
ncbi:glycosyltransferase family 2 protein [Gimesia chilikensis]|uniref:glycosyltransferase family 2 protein n=1 Tax=Gimesia chilikensis TaxID=2605989 RepID=UPI0011EBA00E|nr:glycosyltransferase family 2 protein [Gimesia chilikensis]KAA0140533.1 glycosyltransferase family 2 protein [Gimesia chilikensis]